MLSYQNSEMYDPIKLSNITEKIVASGNKRKYYRFRPTRFYGGIATADTVGCNLRCIFCWSGDSVWHPNKTGDLYSPEEVADRLHEIAYTYGYHQIRVSGGEPTIGRSHLLELLSLIDKHLLFILETNGILLGVDETYVEELSSFSNLHVRVCLKGSTPEEFTWFTACDEKGFEYQLQSLVNLKKYRVSFHIALVTLSKYKLDLYQKLREMGLGKTLIEEEEIKLYPKVKERLRRRGVLEEFLQNL